MNEIEILEYLKHKSTLQNPSPGRFKKNVKEFLLEWAKSKSINYTELKIIFYLYVNNLDKIQICEYPSCNKPTRFISFSKGFSKGCCHDHALRASNLEKYGVEKPFQSKNIQKKIKNTFKEKYGNENPFYTDNFKKTMVKKYGSEKAMHSPELVEKLKKNMNEKYGGIGNASEEIKEKVTQTNLERYGYESIFHSKEKQNGIKKIKQEKYKSGSEKQKEIYDKIKQTNLEKYGVENPFQSEEIKNKIKRTNLEKYGTEKPQQCEEIKEKTKRINLKKYGVENPFQSDKIKNKIKQTNLEKYGAENNKQKHVSNIIFYNDKTFISNNFIINKMFNIRKFCEFFNVTFCTAYKKLKQLNIEYNHNFKSSFSEKELCNILKKSKLNIEENNTSILNGKELDIYIPDKKSAIEFNGIYWHSELNGKDRNYHLNKTKGCEAKGIHLIHIFENEWLENKNNILNIINNHLDIFSNEIELTSYKILEISTKEKNLFFRNNFLKPDNSHISIGFLIKNKIFAIMTFNKINNKEFEICNFCKKYDCKINCGKQFFSYFKKKYNPTSVIVYDNKRYSMANVYKSIGFKIKKVLEPDYWYFGKKIKGIENKSKWGKNLLKNKLEYFDPNLTEWENMKINGYDRIWDCGQNVLEWRAK